MENTNQTQADADRPGIKDKAVADGQKMKHAAQEKVDKTTEQAKAAADNEINEAAETVSELSDVIDAAAETLSDQDREGLASYARQLSGSISSLADKLQSKSIDDLAKDAKAMARNNPNGFLLGSIALGFGLSRFAKATESPESESQSDPAPSADTLQPTDSAMVTSTGQTPSNTYTPRAPL